MASNFSRRNARRVKQSTLRVERQPRQRNAEAADYTAAMRPGCYAYSAVGATAASGATLGTGSAVIQTNSSGTLSTGSPSITVNFYNAGGPITGPVYLLLQWVDGAWSVAVAPCS